MSAITLFDLNGEQRFTGTSVGGGGGGSGPLATATVTLTDAQIKALPTTPVELVAALGAGKVLVPIFCFMHLTWVADYTNIGNTGLIKFPYGVSGAASPLASFQEAAGDVSNLLADSASHCAYSAAGLNVVTTSLSAIGQFADDPDGINQSLQLAATNIGTHTGNYTGGDPGNSLKVTVYYATFTI